MEFFSFENIFLAITGIVYIISIFLTIASIRRRTSNYSARSIQIFLAVIITSFIWFIFNTLSLRSDNSRILTVLGIRGTLAASSIIVPLLMMFFNNLYKPHTVYSAKTEKAFLVIATIIGIISFIPTTVSGIEVIQSTITPIFGPTYILFLVWILFSIFSTIRTIWKLRKNKKLSHQNKWQYVFWGFLLTFAVILVTNLFTVILLKSDDGVLYGPPTLLIFVFICLYTIDASRLVDIKYALDISKRYIITIVLLLLLFLSGNYLLLAVPDFFYIVSFLTGIIVLISVKIIANYIYPASRYDKEVKQFIDRISVELNIKRILREMQKILILTTQARSVSFLIVQKDKSLISYDLKEESKSTGKISYDELYKKTTKLWSRIKTSTVITIEDFKRFGISRNERNKLLKLFSEHKVGLIAPLNKRVTLNGIILLGPKKQNIEYTRNDVDIIERIIQFSSVAISRALLYQETSNFAAKLSRQVKLRTKDLESARADLKTKNLQLQNAFSDLKTLDDAKSEFISIASHQLRTPISIIKGYISMILEEDFGKVNKELNIVLNKAAANTQQLNDIVEDILNASRIEKGKLVITPTKTDLIPIITNVAEQMQGKAKHKKLKLTFNSKIKEFFILADKNKIYEVIMNLVDNALNYTKKGSVTITFETKDGNALIAVKDTGIGIPKEFNKRIFKRFSRSENARLVRPDGTGIGLYVVKSFVEAHEGSLWFESKLGKGSTFFVELPVKPSI